MSEPFVAAAAADPGEAAVADRKGRKMGHPGGLRRRMVYIGNHSAPGFYTGAPDMLVVFAVCSA
jgi:hypothetical protein